MARIFISYRRDDTAGHSGRLSDHLSEHFGMHEVFRDIEDIEPGLDFVQVIEQQQGSLQVLLALIGKQWLTITDEHGRRRLDDPNDLVRVEITTALQRNVRVIPVLVQGAKMPEVHELPEPLAGLARRNAVELHDTTWSADVQYLIQILERVLSQPKRRRWLLPLVAVLLPVVVLGVVVGIYESGRLARETQLLSQITTVTVSATITARPATPTPSIALSPLPSPDITRVIPTTGQTVIVRAPQGVRLRTQPDERAQPNGERPLLIAGSTLTFLAQRGDWWQVRTPEGVVGWVRATPASQAIVPTGSTAPARHFADGSQVIVKTPNGGGIHFRRGPLSTSGEQGMLLDGITLTVTDEVGDWLHVRKAQGAEGWARWYYDGIQYLFPVK